MPFEIILDESFILDTFQRKSIELELSKGDNLRIFVQELTGAWVNAYLLDTNNYERYLNRKSFKYLGAINQTGIHIDVEVINDDIYYLVIEHNKDIRLSKISVKIRRLL
jgi:hypothetical protein